ncbi:MAG: hypothetical protein Q9160_007597 [Pyrenula sp. 1 TL-2023]
MAPTVRVIGSLNVDFVTTTPRFPSAGETLRATSLTISPGGKGANQAVACGRASYTSPGVKDVNVELVGAVGAGDPHYEHLLKPALTGSGVGCEDIAQVKGQTGTATIIVDDGAGGENRILFVPGANDEGMRPQEDVLERALRQPLPDVVVLQGEIPRETTFEILRRIRALNEKQTNQRGCEVVFNPAPVFEEGIPSEVYPLIDHLIVNETESALLGCSPDDRNTFHTRGVHTVITTLGAKGLSWSSNAKSEPSILSEEIEGIEVTRVLDTTAAGDTFVGYYAIALARWRAGSDSQTSSRFLPEQVEAVQRANRAAARCVEKRGAIDSIPWGFEL